MVDSELTPDRGNTPTLRFYRRLIRFYDPLTEPREQARMARRAREGSREARDKLVGAHLRYVVDMAWRYRTFGLSLQDLIAEGTVGVEKAVNSFDERRDGRLTPMALRSARREIERALRDARRRGPRAAGREDRLRP